ncbi:membrane protein insertase YidC [Saccharomonospora viridis]|uniref:Membrane protein insertase YidC n=2 Tax=Saccharomonospora viridis TaxID=1852 RepID=C7MSR0_SACVD|nr:membrane protein insertase YidC [Saccharomonospora viridis]ACU98918.1 preprotein translocase subunit YidC [Saccharomonospora viridis DSM 43017]KHF44720.1 preprotein translocase subunit YidC [Saccharomonospora viridis]SFP22001.1 YidC/Oxa1 family membrane protein insertase [Saccharomonospora viridis]
MLDFIYYPVSFILWVWHKVFGFVFGEDNAIAWVLGIVFLTFTVRGLLFKPFVNQVRSMRKMQDFAPEVKRIQKKYANDRQRQAMELQRLQREHGVNPFGSCLPILLQIPVFIGLNWVLRNFRPGAESNYFFDADDVASYVDAQIFGINLGDAINHLGLAGGGGDSGWNWDVAPLAVPLMIVAGIATHLTARHSVARQNPASATPQTAVMNRLTLYVFPAGVVVFGAFFPIGLLIYWLANNVWTLGQQRFVYKKIDKEEEAKRQAAKEKRDSLAPKPGQKPQVGQKPKPGQKPAQKSAPKQQNQSHNTKNGKSPKGSGSSVRGGAWAKNGGNRPANQGKKTQGRKRR